MPELHTIRGLTRSTVWMRAWKTWICGSWSKIWAERMRPTGSTALLPRSLWSRCPCVPPPRGGGDAGRSRLLSFVPVTGNYPVHYVDVFVLTVLNTLSVTECAELSLRSVKAAFWETLREWECWETLRKVSFEPDVLPKSFLLLIVKQDKHSMSMRRYAKSKDNHVIWL